MWQLPGKNIAFVFSDAAGANACMAMSKICREENKTVPHLFSNKKYNSPGFENVVITEVVPSFTNLKVDCVFTGTSHPASSNHFEVNAIRQANSEKVYTISFVDHWANFKLRFDGLETYEYPNEIWVIDEIAKQLAVSEGLPGEKIVVKGNPYHYFLNNIWKSQFEGKNYLEQFEIPSNGFHILFAPDPLSIRNGKSVGFTEFDALNSLLEIMKNVDGKNYLIVKCHPLQPTEKLQQMINEFGGNNCFLLREADTPELVNASDIVLGFYSNVLLDAEAMGKKVIRYFPGNDEADLLKHKTGLKKMNTKIELVQELKHYIHG